MIVESKKVEQEKFYDEIEDRINQIVKAIDDCSNEDDYIKVFERFKMKMTKNGALDKRLKENKLIIEYIEKKNAKPTDDVKMSQSNK